MKITYNNPKFSSIINESSLQYQTVYRFMSFDEMLEILSGKWTFGDSIAGKWKFGDKVKSFTRNIQIPYMEVFHSGSDILIEVDKDALVRFTGGKVTFKPFNYFGQNYPNVEKAIAARSSLPNEAELTEAEELAQLHTGSNSLTFRPSDINKFIKCVFIATNLNHIREVENDTHGKRFSDKELIEKANKIIEGLKANKVTFKGLKTFSKTPYYSSRKLDQIKARKPKNTEEDCEGLNSGVLGGNIHGGDIVNTDFYATGDNRVPGLLFSKPLKRKKKLFEHVRASKHNMFYRSKKQLKKDFQDKKAKENAHPFYIDYLNVEDLSLEDRIKLEELYETNSDIVAFNKVIKSSKDFDRLDKLARERSIQFFREN